MADQPGSRRTAARGLAVALLGLAAAELVTAVACALAGGISFGDAVASFTVTNGAIGLTLSACGTLLAWHRPRNPVGWLYLVGGIAYAMSAGAIQLVGSAPQRAGTPGCSGWGPPCSSSPGRWRSGCACPWPCCCSPTAARPARAGSG